MGAEPGEQPCEDTAQHKKRKIGENTGGFDEQISSAKLSGIVGKCSQNTDQRKKAVLEKAPRCIHDKQTEQTACRTVPERHELTGKNGGQKNAGSQHAEGIGQTVVAQNDQRDDIGKPRLDSGNGNRQGDCTFYQVNG